VCAVSRHRLPSSVDYLSHSDVFYETFINAFAKSGGFEIAGGANVVLDGREGREYKLKKNYVNGVVRVFLTGSDAYSVSAIAVSPGADAKSISTVLDSFRIIEKSQKDEFAVPPPPPPPPAPLPVPKDSINVSGGMLQASAIKKVEPVYPPAAKAAKAEGEVKIMVIVSEEGKVIDAAAVEGHPLLRDAALQAARQWEFKPAEHSGKPVKVVSVLNFNFIAP
jgi:TonB family protein